MTPIGCHAIASAPVAGGPEVHVPLASDDRYLAESARRPFAAEASGRGFTAQATGRDFMTGDQ